LRELTIKFNNPIGPTQCVLCGNPLSQWPGPALFLDGTEDILCRRCGQHHAPHLLALIDLAGEAEECATLEETNLAYVEMQKLWRAIEDYHAQLQAYLDPQQGDW